MKKYFEIALIIIFFVPLVLIFTVYDVINHTDMPETI